MDWQRVTKANPCVACGKPDWCMVAPKGDVVLCMRVMSTRPHTLASGEVGYFHSTGDAPRRPQTSAEKRPEPVINVGKLIAQWQAETEQSMVEELAEQLCVRASALQRLGCAWAREHRAWAFTMYDGYGNAVGIRLRSNEGQKWAVRGSHQGVFLPQGETDRMTLVCEGPTDVAAALSLGFYAIGRPSCSAGMSDILTAFRRLRVTSAVIISDNDEVGSRGGLALQRHLRIRSTLLVLPCKDLRMYLQLNGTAELLVSMIGSSVWTQP